MASGLSGVREMRSPLPWRKLLGVLACTLVACGGGSNAASVPEPAPPTGSNSWSLVWSDEFDGAAGSAPNPAWWSDNIGNQQAGGWGNHELEYYTAAPRNAFLDGAGLLVIQAEKANAPGPCWNGRPCDYTSARIVTQGKVNFDYGKLEARIKIPSGKGIWPAFWTLGEGPGAWPDIGEIDVMEFVGQTPDTVYSTAHGPGYSGANGLGKPFVMGKPVADDFHVFTLIKRPNEISWQVDGVEVHRLTPASLPAGAPWVFERRYFAILNLAVGGDWPGSPDANTVFPARMSVDWVRLYKEN
jgi:beta-glucanase (GH16 family)